jgi:hypothetical protein
VLSNSFCDDINFPVFQCYSPTGSAYICDPPVKDTDEDYVVLVEEFSQAARLLEAQGWEIGGSIFDGHRNWFFSFKKGKDNLIIVDNPEFYLKFINATKLAKNLNLTEKSDRITLFQAILYNKF